MRSELKPFLEDFLSKGSTQYLPHLSIDCVIFAYEEQQLQVLLTKVWGHDALALPGGFIGKQEDIDHAAARTLQERTGLKEIFLQQFRTFGLAERAFQEEIYPTLDKLGIERQKASWMMGRYVTIGYYALLRKADAKVKVGPLDEDLLWADALNLPPMVIDHEQIIQQACQLLQEELVRKPIAERLLPDQFTIPELQALYETILDRSIDRGNFRKKVLKADILQKLDKRKEGGAHRAPQLYQFHPAHYAESLEQQVKLGF
ncbi:MAG: NUDIX domain-containing protein [Bacteroidota bacterium]